MLPTWLLFTLLTMLLWGGWGVVSKPLSESLSAWQVQAFSSLGMLPVIILLGASRNLRAGARPWRGFGWAFLAGVIGSAGNVAYYQALAAGGKVAAVTPLTSLYPMVTIGLALLFLGERLNLVQAAGVLASLAAMYCFNIGTDTSWLTPWLVLALVPIALWGLSALFQKVATASASNELATLAFLLGELPAALLIPLFTPIHWELSASTWGLLLLLGFLFGLGNLTLIFAYGVGGKAAVVTPMASLYSLISIPLAVTFLGERISGREGLGIILALLAVVALCYEKPSSTRHPPHDPPLGHPANS